MKRYLAKSEPGDSTWDNTTQRTNINIRFKDKFNKDRVMSLTGISGPKLWLMLLHIGSRNLYDREFHKFIDKMSEEEIDELIIKSADNVAHISEI